MGAFTSADIQKYQARYSTPVRPAGYCTIGESKKNRCTIQVKKLEGGGVWEIRPFHSITPSPRIGHCMVYDSANDLAAISYGAAPDNRLLCDFWVIDFCKNEWIMIKVNENDVSPRVGAAAVLINDEMWVFGGSNEQGYLDDLHIINLTNGHVRRPNTEGPVPEPRMNHVMAYHNGIIMVYGGKNDAILQKLHFLDISTLSWTEVNVADSCVSASVAMYQSKAFVYGGRKSTGFLAFDFSFSDASVIPTSGKGPSPSIINSSMVAVDKYIMLIGGESMAPDEKDMQFSPIYMFDPETRQWFVISIRPDCLTTSIKDGEIDSNGEFLLPLCTQSSAIYREKQREVAVFLGLPQNDPPVLFVIQIMEPLSSLHLAKDMVSMLKLSVQ